MQLVIAQSSSDVRQSRTLLNKSSELLELRDDIDELPVAEDELTTSLEVVQSQHTWATQFRGDAKVLSATFCELTESWVLDWR